MKVLHISTDYTYTKLYYELISRLQNKGIENIVYVPANISTKYEKKDNNEEYDVIFSKVYNTIDRFFFKKKEKKIYQDIIKKIDFSTVYQTHAHTLFSAGYISYLLKKEFNIPYVVSVRSTDVNVFFKYRKNLKNIGIKILIEAEKVVCISERYRDILLKKYVPKKYKDKIKNKLVVIHNGIDRYWLENEPNRKIPSKECINLVQTGVVRSGKNFLTTIKVVKKLNKLGIKAKLYAVGDGPLLETYRKKYANEQIIFMGRMPKEQIKELYEKMDIFILPSKTETFGLVYAEAMSQGLPVLYTENEGFDKIFPDGDVGYPIKQKNVTDIIKKIELTKNNYEQISRNACKNSKIFNWDEIVEKFKVLY